MSTKKKDIDGNTASVSLQQVLDASPAEDTAQARVMRSIEQDEETGSSLSAGILAGKEGSSVFQSTKNPSSTKPGSVEEELFGLTSEMKGHAQDDTMNSSLKATHNTDGYNFVRNAGRLIHLQKSFRGEATESYVNFKSFLAFRQDSFWLYSRFVLLYLIIPGLGVTCLLFYVFDNPGAGAEGWDTGASASWWVNFITVRQILTLSFAKGTEVVLIDFFCLGSTIAKRLLGSFFTLMLVQSKGWPFQLLTWAVFDFAMLFGDRRFVPFCRSFLKSVLFRVGRLDPSRLL